MKRVICILLLMACVGVASVAKPSSLSPAVFAAQGNDEHDDVMKALRRGEIMTLARIKNIAQSKLKGRVVSQQLRRTNRGWQYYLRLRQDDGNVISAVVDAKTGKILHVSKPKKRGR